MPISLRSELFVRNITKRVQSVCSRDIRARSSIALLGLLSSSRNEMDKIMSVGSVIADCEMAAPAEINSLSSHRAIRVGHTIFIGWMPDLKFVVSYLDNVLVLSSSWPEHL
ncbi:hypothetical protein PoB_000641700 [Plakobranchus ocellatus]|uniref:Uncharacterized protein n=1 Tax=Plakobranchus ocellatus TaxID=259542 RepID=A0AAV3YCT4_9GAST|nr:hypothetical protein PoB_000641700 [Plakobranchus ocellatus]